jgi:chromosome segregation ATPase
VITEEKSSLIEGVTVGLGVVIVFISTLSGPRLSHSMTPVESARKEAREARYLTNLRKAVTATYQDNETLRTRLTEAGALLEKARLEMTTLTVERDALKADVAAATGQLQEMKDEYQALQAEMTQFRQGLSDHVLAKERDEALERASKAEDRIRELTLQLNRAGIWP